jgi:hypothetical protein
VLGYTAWADAAPAESAKVATPRTSLSINFSMTKLGPSLHASVINEQIVDCNSLTCVNSSTDRAAGSGAASSRSRPTGGQPKAGAGEREEADADGAALGAFEQRPNEPSDNCRRDQADQATHPDADRSHLGSLRVFQAR